MLLVKKSTILSSFVFSKIGLEILLSYGLERKEAFKDDENVNFLNSKNGYLPNGLTHGFGRTIHDFF